jgi:hypothetical protein
MLLRQTQFDWIGLDLVSVPANLGLLISEYSRNLNTSITENLETFQLTNKE